MQHYVVQFVANTLEIINSKSLSVRDVKLHTCTGSVAYLRVRPLGQGPLSLNCFHFPRIFSLGRCVEWVTWLARP